jgi:hypothetical protein
MATAMTTGFMMICPVSLTRGRPVPVREGVRRFKREERCPVPCPKKACDPSNIEEHGFLLALEVDVEHVDDLPAPVSRRRDQVSRARADPRC